MINLLLIAFLLGVKHSYDADHLAAVANFLSKAESVRGSVRFSAYWAAGHMLTAGAITILLYFFRESILQALLGYFEILVAAMLIGIGIYALKDIALIHKHRHPHEGGLHEHYHLHLKAEKSQHYHKHLFGIGIVHGLASNDELLLLFTLSLGITSLAGILSGVLVFTLGVVVGMSVFGMILVTPLLKAKSEKIKYCVGLGAGLASLFYGIYLFINIL